MLETVGRTRINISRLILDEPESSPCFVFDPEQEFSLQDWEGMKGYVDAIRPVHHPIAYDFIGILTNMKLLFPNRASELGLEDLELRGLVGQMLIIDPDKLQENIYREKILFPDLFSRDEATRSWEYFDTSLKNKRSPEGFFHRAFQAKVVFPDKSNEELHIDEDILQKLLREIEELRKGKGHNDWETLASVISYLRFFYPANFRDLISDKQTSNLIRLGFDEERKVFDMDNSIIGLHRWHSICRNAVWMKIIAAEEVKISDNGLEFIMSKPSFQQQYLSFPEMRKF